MFPERLACNKQTSFRSEKTQLTLHLNFQRSPPLPLRRDFRQSQHSRKVKPKVKNKTARPGY